MFSNCTNRWALWFALLGLCIAIGSCMHSQAQQQGWEDDFKPGSLPGKRTFAASCAGCHGLDGRGGQRAPNIAGNAKLRHLSNAEISAIVTNGVPGTGMPAFHSLPPAEVQAVVAYLRVLQGREKSQQIPGDAGRGKTIFFGKGDCASCHMIQGRGGFMGSDLSGYGANRSATEILNVIVDPANKTEWKRKAGTVVTRDGRRISGIIRNEDNFSIQLQTADAAFHLLSKSDVQSLEYQDHPVMPTNYTERLNHGELEDVIKYLLNVAQKLHPDSADDE